MNRIVTLVLVDAAGTVLGALPPFETPVPWWQESADLVAEARHRHGVEVSILRLLSSSHPAPPGGKITYLAQVDTPVRTELTPVDLRLDDEPLRAPWVVPDGPQASVRWALQHLPPGAQPVQRRTWNLSSIWRFDLGGRPVAWLKQVPAFFAHEPGLLTLLASHTRLAVPEVLAVGDAGRMLLAHIPGEDQYGAGADFRAEVARDLHPVQEHFATRTDTLRQAGLPDRRLDPSRLTRVAEPWLEHIDGLDDLLDEIPARLAAIAACGLPDTLVHGDLHPGNVRAQPGGPRTIIDWGDAGIGHPASDMIRLTGGIAGRAVLDAWAQRWQASVPGSEPLAALELIRPVTALHQAVTYQHLLDHIEPAEHPYHAADVPRCLSEAVAAAQPSDPRAAARLDAR
ncbi:phosphotransferase family protein [Actinoplanes sp. TFC3]|uniref:phosphotransferase family protein n=1 Tax=Actinoplanes sp. TFC3 TaxID=1710355 RepID=UPI0008326EF9|nr:phosphotransferase [Actinoplanes sp. TFC3]